MLKRVVISGFLVVLALALAVNAFAQDNTGKAFLGVGLEDADEGVRVTEVMPGSPADDAGLQAGDIITAIGGESVTAESLRDTMRQHQPGDTLDLTIERDGASRDVTVTLGTRPEEAGHPGFQHLPEGFEGDFLFYNGNDQVWEVRGLSENNPLAEAGLQEGDKITAFNGEAYDPAQLQDFIAGLGADDTVTLTVERNGDTIQVDVPADALNALALGGMRFGFGHEGGFPFDILPFGMGGGSRLGVTFVTLDEQVAQENHVDATEGALIVEVAAGSPAAEAGLQADDVVTAVNGEVVDAERTLRDRLFAYEPGDTVTLSVLRGTETMDIDVTLGQAEMPSEFMPFFGGPHGFRFGPNGEPFGEPQTPEVPQSNL